MDIRRNTRSDSNTLIKIIKGNNKLDKGHIQYVRVDDPSNLAGLRAIVERGMEMGFYQGVNFDSMFCNHCGHHTTPKNGKIVTCGDCGSHDVTVISRVCG